MDAVVVALGKIGLPLGAYIARAGHSVVGCDIDESVVATINDARSPFPGEHGLEDVLAELVPAGRLRAQTDTTSAVAAGPDLVIAVPPLLIDDVTQPDYTAVDDVTAAIGRGLKAGTTVVFETTLPVGATRARIAPVLERESGLAVDRDFFVAFSPERVSSGRVFRDLDTYPKLVGGVGPASETRAAELYRAFITADVWEVGSAEAAELTKLAETTYRSINIAFANELARHADRAGVDVAKVIEAANSQPYSHVHRPGIAVGGHCIPVYPHLYLLGDPDARLPRVGVAVNEAMPAYAVHRLADAAGGLAGKRALILGVAYRGGVKETAFSGAFAVRDAIAQQGGTPLAHDPLYDDAELTALGFAPWDREPVDVAIIQADHGEYAALTPEQAGGATVVLDGRDALDATALDAAGVRVVRLGRP
jgi:UDP-N-acetyl-D-mannosaminuronic acid dehydrogenase